MQEAEFQEPAVLYHVCPGRARSWALHPFAGSPEMVPTGLRGSDRCGSFQHRCWAFRTSRPAPAGAPPPAKAYRACLEGTKWVSRARTLSRSGGGGHLGSYWETPGGRNGLRCGHTWVPVFELGFSQYPGSRFRGGEWPWPYSELQVGDQGPAVVFREAWS